MHRNIDLYMFFVALVCVVLVFSEHDCFLSLVPVSGAATMSPVGRLVVEKINMSLARRSFRGMLGMTHHPPLPPTAD